MCFQLLSYSYICCSLWLEVLLLGICATLFVSHAELVFHMGKVSQSGLVQGINPAVCIHLFPQRDNDQHGTALMRKERGKLSYLELKPAADWIL